MATNKTDPKWTTRCASTAAQKGAFTRVRSACLRLADDLRSNPSSVLVTEANHFLEKMRMQKDRCDEAYTALACDFPNEDNKVEDKTATLDAEYEEARDLLVQAIDAAGIPAAPPLAAAPTPRSSGASTMDGELTASLKPFTLTLDHKPAEFRTWLNRFKAYYGVAKLGQLSLAEQRAFFSNCIDPMLEEMLQPEINASTTVFEVNAGDACCVKSLTDVFAMVYPLYTRRTDYLRETQSEGETYAQFSRRLKMMAAEAMMNHLSAEDHLALRIITATNDQRLRDKFHKLVNPTMAEVDRVGNAYDIEMKNKASDAVRVAAAVAPRGRPSGRKPERKGKAGQGSCQGCGSSRHNRRSCPALQTTCNSCGKIGHLAKVCRSSGQATDADASNPPSWAGSGLRSPGRQPSPSPTRSDRA